MKFMIAALSVLMGCSAGAQGTTGRSAYAPMVELQAIQVEQIRVFGTWPYFDADPAAGALSDPVAAKTMPSGASGITASSLGLRPVEFKKFQKDNVNRALVATEFWARGLDALSTYNKLKSPCRCYREASSFLGFDMAPVFKNQAGAYAYSFGVAAAYSVLSAQLWNASKNHPRHARFLQRLSRFLLVADSSLEIATDIHNLHLTNGAR